MKFIGQYIQSFIARFRNDVYLEDVSTGTIASGGNLGLDSNNKIVKANEATGDITGVALTAGTGVDLTSVSGATGGAYAATIGVDVSDFMSSGAVTNVLTATGTDAMQSEEYFTFRNTVNNSSLSLLSNEDTGDFFNIGTTTHGATTLSTVDDDATAAHFEIAADGNITLDSAASIYFESAGSTLSETVNGWRWYTAGNIDDFLGLSIGTHGDATFTTVDDAAAAAHFEIAADGDITLDAAGQIKLEPGTSVLWDSLALTGIQASSESFNDDDVSLMTSKAISDHVKGKYSTSYITFSVKTSNTHGTNYILLHGNGVSGGLVSVNSGVDSATDFGGVTAEKGGGSTETCSIQTANLEQQIPIPETCKLIGFYATTTTTSGSGSGDASVDTGVAIWHMPEANVNWGGSTAGTATLIHKSDSSLHAENTAHSGTNRKKVQKVERMGGTPMSLAAGDIIIPSVFGETADQQITATITLVIATPIKTIT